MDEMTDRELMAALLARFGLEPISADERQVTLESGMDKVHAYTGFQTTFIFRTDGTFQEVDIWE